MSFTEFFNTYINTDPGIRQILLRLLCAMLVGLVIGVEREYTHRPAGLRTHILVALGACAISITGEMLFHQYSSQGAMPDPARLSAQVITGVGFLGAGTIMKEGATVKGLTTAASVWAVACLGVAAGFGYYGLVLAGMILILITLTIFETLQRKFLHTGSSDVFYVLETGDLSLVLNQLNAIAQEQQVMVLDLSAEQLEKGHRLSFRVHFTGRRHRKHHQRFFDALASAQEVQALRQSDSKIGSAV